MILTIEKIVYPGKSLARKDGKVIFSDEGLPGETIEASILKETKNYVQCKTTGIITPSPYRQAPACDHYEACSLYQYIDYPYQVEIKKEQLLEMLTRQAKIDMPNIDFRSSNKTWGYRNKIKLNIIWKDKRPVLAYNMPGFIDQFIPIDKCLLSPERTNLFLTEFIEVVAAKSLEAIKEVTVRENSKNELLAIIQHDSSLNIGSVPLAFQHLLKKFPISGLILIDQETLKKTIVSGDDFFKEKINDIELYIGSGSFFQINTDMLSILIKDLRGNLGLSSEKVLADLYCGVGTFGNILSSNVKRVIGVESEPENFFFMEKNIKLNNIKNFDVSLCDCRSAIDSVLNKKIDIAIIDPPRKGIDISISHTLSRSGPQELAYISCNPATLVRDLKILISSYDIKSLFAYDFFPHTPHIEVMVLLRKK
ncbi:MAG: 23S rRNA (uracil(1939)-C(5))-methyltransferase RlmD [Candidatus Omnitrophota bacterium]